MIYSFINTTTKSITSPNYVKFLTILSRIPTSPITSTFHTHNPIYLPPHLSHPETSHIHCPINLSSNHIHISTFSSPLPIFKAYPIPCKYFDSQTKFIIIHTFSHSISRTTFKIAFQFNTFVESIYKAANKPTKPIGLYYDCCQKKQNHRAICRTKIFSYKHK